MDRMTVTTRISEPGVARLETLVFLFLLTEGARLFSLFALPSSRLCFYLAMIFEFRRGAGAS
jgi:hypothetical protein